MSRLRVLLAALGIMVVGLVTVAADDCSGCCPPPECQEGEAAVRVPFPEGEWRCVHLDELCK